MAKKTFGGLGGGLDDMDLPSFKGGGLSSLIPMTEDPKVEGASSLNEIKISEIEANPDQPRREFDEETLAELAESIKAVGVIQPITLRKVGDHKYQIIAGERRYRASKLAGLETIPAYVREVSDEQLMEMALVENIQREDLNAIEIALSYQNLMDKCDYTQDQLSDRVGKKRATVANYVRLLRLPAEIQMGLKNHKIEMGHARALLATEDSLAQLQIYNQTVEEGLSVRKVEELVRNIGKTKKAKESGSADNNDTDYSAIKERLSSLFSSNVDLSCNTKGKGKITIPFKNEDELAKILEIFDLLQ